MAKTITAENDSMTRLLEFLTELEQHKIHYTLEHNREDAVMVVIAVPGERWEAEFFANANVEVEVFRSIGMSGYESLERLFQDFSG